MIGNIPPGLIMIVGAMFLPLLRRRDQAYGVLGLSIASLAAFCFTAEGSYGNIQLFGQTLCVVRIDSLSWIFGLIFHLAAIMSAIA